MPDAATICDAEEIGTSVIEELTGSNQLSSSTDLYVSIPYFIDIFFVYKVVEKLTKTCFYAPFCKRLLSLRSYSKFETFIFLFLRVTGTSIRYSEGEELGYVGVVAVLSTQYSWRALFTLPEATSFRTHFYSLRIYIFSYC